MALQLEHENNVWRPRIAIWPILCTLYNTALQRQTQTSVPLNNDMQCSHDVLSSKQHVEATKGSSCCKLHHRNQERDCEVLWPDAGIDLITCPIAWYRIRWRCPSQQSSIRLLLPIWDTKRRLPSIRLRSRCPPPESPLRPTPASLLKLRTGQQQHKRSARSVLHDAYSMLANPYVNNIKVKLDNIMKPAVHSFDELGSQSQESRQVGTAVPSPQAERLRRRREIPRARQDELHRQWQSRVDCFLASKT